MDIQEKIKEVIDKDIIPMVSADGGGVEFIDFKDDIVTVELKGACQGCPMSEITLKEFIEKTLKDQIPEVKEVKKN